MSFLKVFAAPIASALVLGMCVSPRAAAFDVGVDLELGKPKPPVIVQPPAHTARRWVPETIVRREEKILVEPHHRVERREEKVLVEPAHVIKREERVLVVPEHLERRTEQVLVRPGRVEKVWVPAVTSDVKIGPVSIGGSSKEGYFREVQHPPVYETVVKTVVVPARYDVAVKNLEIPARYEVRIVEVPIPPRYEIVYKDVVVPGHWEETTVVPPPVVVKPSRPSFELDIDVKSKHHD